MYVLANATYLTKNQYLVTVLIEQKVGISKHHFSKQNVGISKRFLSKKKVGIIKCYLSNQNVAISNLPNQKKGISQS